MNEVQVIKRNDTSDVPKILPIIMDLLSEGIPLTKILKENKNLPRKATIYRWIDLQEEPLRQEILDKLAYCRELGADTLVDEAQVTAREPIYDKEDAVIKVARVKMLLDVSKAMKPRLFQKDLPFLETLQKSGKVEETVYPAMTKEQAMALLRSKEDKK